METRVQIFVASILFFILVACAPEKAPEEPQNRDNEAQAEPPVVSDHSRLPEAADAYLRSGYPDSVNRGHIYPDTYEGSPRVTKVFTIRDTRIEIDYASPGVRDREIFGALVPWEKPWVAGAHNATIVTFSKDVKVARTPVPAGKYAFFAIPRPNRWELILNTDWNQHQTDHYDPKKNVAVAHCIPLELSTPVQRLTYEFHELDGGRGGIMFKWADKQVVMPFSVL